MPQASAQGSDHSTTVFKKKHIDANISKRVGGYGDLNKNGPQTLM